MCSPSQLPAREGTVQWYPDSLCQHKTAVLQLIITVKVQWRCVGEVNRKKAARLSKNQLKLLIRPSTVAEAPQKSQRKMPLALSLPNRKLKSAE